MIAKIKAWFVAPVVLAIKISPAVTPTATNIASTPYVLNTDALLVKLLAHEQTLDAVVVVVKVVSTN